MQLCGDELELVQRVRRGPWSGDLAPDALLTRAERMIAALQEAQQASPPPRAARQPAWRVRGECAWRVHGVCMACACACACACHTHGHGHGHGHGIHADKLAAAARRPARHRRLATQRAPTPAPIGTLCASSCGRWVRPVPPATRRSPQRCRRAPPVAGALRTCLPPSCVWRRQKEGAG